MWLLTARVPRTVLGPCLRCDLAYKRVDRKLRRSPMTKLLFVFGTGIRGRRRQTCSGRGRA
jgi:hypothetical protein